MVTVELGDSFKTMNLPANKKSVWFFNNYQKAELLNQLEEFAAKRKQVRFVAKDNEELVAIGTLETRKVLKARDSQVTLAASHAWHDIVPGVTPPQPGKTYDLAIDPGTNEILYAEETDKEAKRLGAESLPTTDPVEKLKPVSMQTATAFFDIVRQQPHIPFQYAADGCWARAHEMCRLIERYLDGDPAEVVGKVWLHGNLAVRSPNLVNCVVSWSYHVAPILRGSDGNLIVLDPSLKNVPITLEEWRTLQNDPHVVATFSSHHVYCRSVNGGDRAEGPNETEKDMAEYRQKLIAQIYANGPIPYKKCLLP
jgi:hypothetical protein